MALKAHPTINASLDEDGEHIIFKDYVNIGIAVDTDRGLVVPSLRGPDQMSIPDIARALGTIGDNMRDGKINVAELQGSTFTIRLPLGDGGDGPSDDDKQAPRDETLPEVSAAPAVAAPGLAWEPRTA